MKLFGSNKVHYSMCYFPSSKPYFRIMILRWYGLLPGLAYRNGND